MKSVALVALAATAGVACADILYDTGAHDTVLFNAAETNLGWTSGDGGAGLEQRWTAQPFAINERSQVTSIFASYFVPGANPTDIAWTVWNRSGAAAPVDGDQVASGSAPFVDVTASLATNFVLEPGDYYLTVYGVGATIGWFTNAPNPINFQDANGASWMWRSAQFPSPGFAQYQLDPSVLDVVDPINDSRDYLYSAEFRLEGVVPTPGAAALLGLAGLGAARRRR